MANGEGRPAWADALELLLTTLKTHGVLDRACALDPTTGFVELHPPPPPAPPPASQAERDIAAERRNAADALREYERKFGAAGGIRKPPPGVR